MEITDQIQTTVEEDIYAIKISDKISSLKFEPFMCDICNESFVGKSHFTHHTNQHKYECDLCKKVFTQKCSLKTHYFIHEGTKPFKCNSCHRGFGDRSTLRKHSLIHSGMRPHVCQMCNRSFVQKVTLRKHLLTHTGEKAHVCETCGRAFAQKSTLRTHYRTHSFGLKRGRRPRTLAQIPCIYPLQDESSDSIIGNVVLDDTNIHLKKKKMILSASTSLENQCKSQGIEHVSHNEVSKMSKLKQEDGEPISVITNPDRKEIDGHPLFKDCNKDPHLEYISIKVESSNNNINSSPNMKDTLSPVQYACNICDLHFPRNFLLIEHINNHRNEQFQVFPNGASNTQNTTIYNKHSPETSVSQNHHTSHLNHEHDCECCEGSFTHALGYEKHCEYTLEQNNECCQNTNKMETLLNLSSNVFVPENKRKQSIPRKVLQLPAITDIHRLDSSEDKFIQNGQLASISSKFGLNDWKKKSVNHHESPSKKLLLKYIVPSIKVIDPL